MIYSPRHRFIFIKTRKTAGTSLEVRLSQVAGADAVVTPIVPPETGHEARNHGGGFYNHMPAVEVRALVGDETWKSSFKFAFERNPWDKVVSVYWFRYRKFEARPAFEEFIEQDGLRSDFELYSVDGELAVDFLGRYEELEQDLASVGERIGITLAGMLPKAKSGYREEGRHYRDYYSERTRRLVEAMFHREIALLNYTF